MKNNFKSVKDYIASLPEDRRKLIQKLRSAIRQNLPKGFEETISYGMIGYVVPLSLYPEGYHCNPKEPLPFINLANQKNYIAIYHMGLYADKKLYDWFISEYKKISKKIDVGKSCIRFKVNDEIPYELIGELVKKITPQDWIKIYDSILKSKNK